PPRARPIFDSHRLLLPSLAKLRGGGGGGDQSNTPASKGSILRIEAEPLAPPTVVNRAENPKLLVEAALAAPPEVNLPKPELPLWGLSTGVVGPPSNGPGKNGGIGGGNHGGVGDGDGPGAGPDPGHGF